VVGFVILSAIPTKLQTYIVPIFPGMAILLGSYIDVLIRRNRPAPLILTASGMLALAIAPPFLIHMLAFHYEPAAIVAYMVSTALIIGTALSIWLNRKDAFRIAITTFSAIIFGCGALLPLLFTLYHDRYQVNIDKAVAYSLEQGANLATVRYSLPSVIFRYGRKIPLLDSEADVQQYEDEHREWWRTAISTGSSPSAKTRCRKNLSNGMGCYPNIIIQLWMKSAHRACLKAIRH
jgi:4-amino-4-deoxy-L-arabinose transferase-like glycosyltransferase